jgi:hypothetical protein
MTAEDQMGDAVGRLYRVNRETGRLERVNEWNNWRNTWHSIVPVRLETTGSGHTEGLFFYDRDNGDATIYTMTSDGQLVRVREHGRSEFLNLRWDIVTPSLVPVPLQLFSSGPDAVGYYPPGVTPPSSTAKNALLTYSRDTGFATTFSLGIDGSLEVIDVFKGEWRTTWDTIVLGARILFYDRGAREVVVYDYSPGAPERERLRNPRTHRDAERWDRVLYVLNPIHAANAFTLFYRRPSATAPALAKFYMGFGTEGVGVELQQLPTTLNGRAWDILLPGEYIYRRERMGSHNQLLAYSRADHLIRLIEVKAIGDEDELGRQSRLDEDSWDDWRALEAENWTHIVRGRWPHHDQLNEYLLFYRAEP